MKKITIDTEYIKLDSFLKYVGLVDSGGVAKHLIKEGMVFVNGEPEIRRGKKLKNNDVVKFQDKEFIIEIK